MDSDPARFSNLRIYIANGDDEQTLCRSNEELHMLMRSRGIKHEYRVLDGGHEFIFWRAQLATDLTSLTMRLTAVNTGETILRPVRPGLLQKQRLRNTAETGSALA
mgnify:CR=1 FL=1